MIMTMNTEEKTKQGRKEGGEILHGYFKQADQGRLLGNMAFRQRGGVGKGVSHVAIYGESVLSWGDIK